MSKSIDLFKKFFEKSVIGLIIFDVNDRITYYNDSFQKKSKYNKNDLLGKDFIDIIYIKDRNEFKKNFKKLLSSKVKSYKMDMRYINKKSETRWCNIKVNSILDDKKHMFIFALFDDITSEKIEAINLKNSKENAERSTKIKSEFLANMSHEIRTPLHTIIGMNELLLETKLDAEQQEYIEQIKFSSDVLSALINDVLDYSKIEASKLELESINYDLHKLIEDAVKLVVLDAHKKGLEVYTNINKDVPYFVKCDPVRLRQIVTNLINNAVKFTEKGEIEAYVELLEEKRNKCKIKVQIRDTGIGISEDKLDKLFHAFSQIDTSTTRIYGGTGLGLSISKSLVNLMEGEIGVHSNKHVGTTFWFTVVLDRVEESARTHENINDDFKKLHILLVDDNKNARTVTKKYLEECGCNVEESEGAHQAIKMLLDASYNNIFFDYCFIDLLMPKMDGWQLASEINSNDYIKNTKLILLCPLGRSADEAKMKLLKWFDGYIYKPIRRSDIINLFKKLVKNQQEPEELEELSSYTEEEITLDIKEKNKKILVADDHEVNQRLFKIMLENMGYTVLIAEDGAEAVTKADKDIDIIFMDVHMPKLQGYDASKMLREKGFNKPIIAVTATNLKIEKDKCLKFGMDDFLSKPFKKKDLILILKKWLNASKNENLKHTVEDNFKNNDIEIFDYKKAVENFLGNKDVVLELLDVFVDKFNIQILDIKDAINAGKLAKVSEIAHSIKGSSLTLEIRSIGREAKSLENFAKNNLKTDTERSLINIKNEFEKLKKVILDIKAKEKKI